MSHQVLTIDDETEVLAKLFRRLFAQQHTGQKNLEIIRDRAVCRIDVQTQADLPGVRIQFQLRFIYGVVHPVVDVIACRIHIAYPGTAHVRFVG